MMSIKTRSTKTISLVMSMFVLTILVIVLSATKLVVRAEENIIEEISYEEINIDVDEIDNEALFEGYVYKQFYGDMGISTFSSVAGDRLSGQNKLMYEALKKRVKKIADGEISSTRIEIPVVEILGDKLEYTAEELGVSAIIIDSKITAEAKGAVFNYDLDLIFDDLLLDLAYEMYWYDVIGGAGMAIPYRATYDTLTREQMLYFEEDSVIEIECAVSGDFVGSEPFTIDAKKIGSVPSAVSTAKSIVAQAANLSDEEKLIQYCSKICQLTSYNDVAASNHYDYQYGNPWQLIWVFDMNEETEVVCEGYSKAFQYLCDLTEFDDENIYSYIVTGNMAEGSPGTGAHMWNIVHMDDNRNYLVDVTNVDGGYSLFLRSASGGDRINGYYFEINDYGISSNIYYTYDADTIAAYSRDELILATEPYEGGVEHAADTSGWKHDSDKHWHSCVVAGCQEKYDIEGHSSARGYVIDKQATCSEKGRRYVVCDECHTNCFIEEITYNYSNHKGGEEKRGIVIMTCTQDGYTGDIYCTGCNRIKSSGQTVPSSGHSWDSGKVLIAPTTTMKGTKEYVCLNNKNHKKYEDIPMLVVTPTVTPTTEITPTPSPTKTPTPTAVPTKAPTPTKPLPPSDSEAVKAFVGRLYSVVLGREADAAGLKDWSQKLIDRERTGSEVALGFFMSQEMIDRNLSDEDYVKICYRTMLNREADAGGLADWVSKLENGRSREAVLYGFSNSVEFGNICNQYGIERGTLQSRQNRDQNDGITSFVARCYTKALGRKFDVDGLNDWSGVILKAKNKKQIAEKVASDGFFHSQEFANKNTSNGEYVEILYRTFLGREYDEAGYNDWVGKLDSGVSRDEVLYGFSRSQEFSNIMASYGL